MTPRPDQLLPVGVIDRTCHICGSFDASRGVGPPAVPVERWYCGPSVSDCLPVEHMVGRERELAERTWGRAAA